MMRMWLCIKGNHAAVVEAAGTDLAFRIGGKALGIDTDAIDDTGDIDLDRCVEITFGVPVDIGPDKQEGIT